MVLTLDAASVSDAEAAAPFWSAMLTVVPVLALAMGVEVNRQVRRVETLSWRWRLLQSSLLCAYALALLVSFRMTLDALANRDGLDRAPLVGGLVWSSLLLLAALPIWETVLRVNPEVAEVIRRLMPWSAWRKHRRLLRRVVLKEVRDTRRQVEEGIERYERLRAKFQQALAEARFSQRAWVNRDALLAKLPPEALELPEWGAVEAAADDLGLAMLGPGNEVGKLEWQAQDVDVALQEQRDLLRKTDNLVRRVEVRIRSMRVFRFNRSEKQDFVRSIRSVIEEVQRVST